MTEIPPNRDEVFTTAELSIEECMALCYAQMLDNRCKPEDFIRATAITRQDGLTEWELRKRIQIGLAGLHEKGIVECERDGHRELVPRVIHYQKIVGGQIVMGDMN